MGWEAHPKVRVGLEGPPGGLGGVGKPTRRFVRGRESYTGFREG